MTMIDVAAVSGLSLRKVKHKAAKNDHTNLFNLSSRWHNNVFAIKMTTLPY